MQRLLIILIFGLAFAAPAGATEIDVRVPEAAPVGEPLVIRVLLRLDEPINAISGTLRYDPDLFSVESVSDVGSIMSLWIERPAVETAGLIRFSGIVPGGITGAGVSDVLLFSVHTRPVRTGIASFQVTDIEAFLNEADARPAAIVASPKSIRITLSATPVVEATGDADVAPPEPFAPTLVNDPLLQNGQWVVVYQTTDKQSGLVRYEIRERFLGFPTSWRVGEGPTVLSDQSRLSIIEVRAIDGAGNERLERLVPVRLRILWILLGVLAVLLIFNYGRNRL